MPNDLEEALTAAGAAPLIQKQIDPVLLEYVRRYSPLVRALPTVKWGSNVYYFNQRTALATGGAVQDGGARPVSTSTYVQNQFTVRNFQSVGAVTGYAQAVTADLIGNLRATEIEGAARGLLWDIETAVTWGNSAATVAGPYPTFDGFDTQINTFSGDTQNAINVNHANLSLGYLDQLIDMVESNIAMPVYNNQWMLVMSPTADSRIAQLVLNQQRFNDVVEVVPGLIVQAYRNIPIIKSSFLAPRSDVMGAVTTALASGGSLTSGTEVFYRLAPVQARYGEIQACAEVNATPSGGNLSVTLSFTVQTGPDSAAPILYKVFRSTSTGAETLLGYVDANVMDAFGNVYAANQIVDNGVTLVPGYYNGSTVTTNAAGNPAAYVGTNSGVQPLNAGDQNIYLIPRDPNLAVRPFVRDLTPVDVYPTTSSPDSLPFAFVSDTTLAIRGPKYVGRLATVNVTLSS